MGDLTKESSQSSGSGTRIDCTEPDCDNDDAVAIWDDELLSGNIAFVCHECSNATRNRGREKVPEWCLWNASKIEENAAKWDGAYPEQRKSHPLDEDETWAVIENEGERLREEERFDIFVWDVENRAAVEAARSEIRRRKHFEALRESLSGVVYESVIHAIASPLSRVHHWLLRKKE